MPPTHQAAKLAPTPAPLLKVVNNNTDPYTHLVFRLETIRKQFFETLCDPVFYVELMFIAISLAIAWLLSVAIHRRVKDHFEKKPLKLVGSEFITKPLSLLTPVLALILLTTDKLVSEMFDIPSGGTDAAIQLAVAWALVRCVFLVVHSRPVARFIATVIIVVAAIRAMHFLHSMTVFLDSVALNSGNFHLSLLDMAHGVVILVVVFWIANVLTDALESYLRRSSSLSYNARDLTVTCFKLFVYFIALIITLSTLHIDLTAFAVFGGALGVGVGLGLQKLTGSFFSSVTLLMEKSVKIGDLIEVGGYTGWVRQINIRYALLETADGREIMIPNDVMTSSNLTNWTHSSTLANVEIKVTIEYGSDARKARELMLAAAREHPRCLHDPAPNCFLQEFGDHGLRFSVTFWISDIKEGRAGPQNDVMFTILDKFAGAGITIVKV